MAKGCALSTGYLPRGGLPRNSADRITDLPDMTSAVDRGRKASTQTNKKTNKQNKIGFYIDVILMSTLVQDLWRLSLKCHQISRHGIYFTKHCYIIQVQCTLYNKIKTCKATKMKNKQTNLKLIQAL